MRNECSAMPAGSAQRKALLFQSPARNRRKEKRSSQYKISERRNVLLNASRSKIGGSKVDRATWFAREHSASAGVPAKTFTDWYYNGGMATQKADNSAGLRPIPFHLLHLDFFFRNSTQTGKETNKQHCSLKDESCNPL